MGILIGGVSGEETDMCRNVRDSGKNETVSDQSQEGSTNSVTSQKQKAEKKKKKSKKKGSVQLSPLNSSDIHQVPGHCNNDVHQEPHSLKCTSRKGAEKKRT